MAAGPEVVTIGTTRATATAEVKLTSLDTVVIVLPLLVGTTALRV
jgi:hypothetical protein